MKSVLLRFGGFISLPLLSMVAPFLLLPIISRIVGAAGWGNYLAGNTIGLIGYVVVLYGWGVVGPVKITQSSSEPERQTYYLLSLYTRFLVLIIVLPVVILLTVLVTGDSHKLDAILMAISGVLGGITSNWYCIGIGKPSLIAKYDALPKMIVTLAVIPIVLMTHFVWVYPTLIILVTIVTAVLFARMVLRGAKSIRVSSKDFTRALRELLSPAAIDLLNNSYANTPMPIASGTLSQQAASVFGSAERLYRISLLAVIAFGDAFQGWVLERDADSRKRQKVAIVSHMTLGVIGGLLIAFAGPPVTALVFGEAVAATKEQCIGFGIAFVCISISTPFVRNIIIPAGKVRLLLIATSVASCCGLAGMLFSGLSGFGSGISLFLGVSEFVICVIVIPIALKIGINSNR